MFSLRKFLASIVTASTIFIYSCSDGSNSTSTPPIGPLGDDPVASSADLQQILDALSEPQALQSAESNSDFPGVFILNYQSGLSSNFFANEQDGFTGFESDHPDFPTGISVEIRVNDNLTEEINVGGYLINYTWDGDNIINANFIDPSGVETDITNLYTVSAGEENNTLSRIRNKRQTSNFIDGFCALEDAINSGVPRFCETTMRANQAIGAFCVSRIGQLGRPPQEIAACAANAVQTLSCREWGTGIQTESRLCRPQDTDDDDTGGEGGDDTGGEGGDDTGGEGGDDTGGEGGDDTGGEGGDDTGGDGGGDGGDGGGDDTGNDCSLGITTARCCLEDNDPETPSCSGTWGDPHIITGDRLNYEFQTVGEFVLVRSQVSDLEVQSRQAAWRTSRSVSVNVGVAMNLDGRKVSIQQNDDRFDLYVNENLIDLDTFMIDDFGNGSGIQRTGNNVDFTWLDGSRVGVRLRAGRLDLVVHVADRHGGQVEGVNGDFDGDPSNDLFTSDGVFIGLSPDFETLNRTFADSWRVTDESSLFFYSDGQNTDVFTDLTFPGAVPTISAFTDAQREAARAICQNEGISEPMFLDACIFDVLVTGDNSFATLFELEGVAMPMISIPTTQPSEVTGAVGISVPERVVSGSSIPINWRSTENSRVRIAPVGVPYDVFISASSFFDIRPDSRGEGSGALFAPWPLGEYEVRMIQGTDILASQRFEVISPSLSIADTAISGDLLEITWAGIARNGARVRIAPVGVPFDVIISSSSFFDIRPDSRLTGTGELFVPWIPNAYEVRIIVGEDILASETFQVVAPSINGPTSGPPGAPIEFAWSGPRRNGVRVRIAPVGAPFDVFVRSSSFFDIRPNSTARGTGQLTLPPEPGTYEVRMIVEETVIASYEVIVGG